MRGTGTASKRAAVAALVILIGTVASGCRQIAAITDRSIAPACGAAAYVDAKCGECTDQSCCAELTACASDPVCAVAQACLAKCAPGDDACRTACAADHGDGFDAALAKVLACEAASCNVECGSSSCSAAPEPSTACASCSKERCCAQTRACGESSACLTRRFRRARCAESTCRNLSDVRNPDGALADQDLTACERSSCLGECASWTCVDAPPRTSGSARVTIAVGDSLTPTPVAGLRVRSCQRHDVECSLGGATVTTNGAGAAVFDVSVGKGAFDGYFEISDAEGDRPPTLVFPAPAITADRVISVPSFTSHARDAIVDGLGLDVAAVASSAAIVARPLDCARNEGAGIRLELDPPVSSAVEFYLDRRLPVVASTSSTTDDVIAFGGFVGVTPVNHTLRGRSAGARRVLFELGVLARSGAITFVEFAPR